MGFGAAVPTASAGTGGAVQVLNSSGDVSPTGNISPDYLSESTTALAASATYTGAWLDTSTLGYARVFALAAADQAGTLYVDFSEDGTNVSISVSASIAAPASPLVAGYFADEADIETALIGRYVRVRVVNGSTAQTKFACMKRFSMA